MNGDVTTAGISWRSFKLTQILQPSFSSSSHKIVATAHSYGHKTKLQESLVFLSILILFYVDLKTKFYILYFYLILFIIFNFFISGVLHY